MEAKYMSSCKCNKNNNKANKNPQDVNSVENQVSPSKDNKPNKKSATNNQWC